MKKFTSILLMCSTLALIVLVLVASFKTVHDWISSAKELKEQTRVCFHCKETVTTAFCTQCGRRVINEATCENCGILIRANDQHCGHCGKITQFNLKEYPSEKPNKDAYDDLLDENKTYWI